MKMKQVELSKGNTKCVSWIDDNAKIKKGNSVRFKYDSVFWHIDKVYDLSIDTVDINRSWHVGGL